MGFLPSCNCVGTTVWMHHMNANKMRGEKTRWDIHKNAICGFEQILEATPHKTAAVYPFTSHLTNHAGHCWRSKDKLKSDILLWSPTLPLTSHLTKHPSKTNKTCWPLLEK